MAQRQLLRDGASTREAGDVGAGTSSARSSAAIVGHSRQRERPLGQRGAPRPTVVEGCEVVAVREPIELRPHASAVSPSPAMSRTSGPSPFAQSERSRLPTAIDSPSCRLLVSYSVYLGRGASLARPLGNGGPKQSQQAYLLVVQPVPTKPVDAQPLAVTRVDGVNRPPGDLDGGALRRTPDERGYGRALGRVDGVNALQRSFPPSSHLPLMGGRRYPASMMPSLHKPEQLPRTPPSKSLGG